MSELRQDPITGRWVVIAEGRSARPDEYRGRPSPAPAGDCPFCEGNESRTPAELAAFGPPGRTPNSVGWTVRSIPNRFPTLLGPVVPDSGAEDRGVGSRLPAHGFHEVIIMGPRHTPEFAQYPADRAAEVLRMGRDRAGDFASRAGVRSVVLFENSGPESGGTLTHPHAQLLGLPVVPPELEEERSGAERFARAANVPCAAEAVAQRELSAGERLVWTGPHLVVVTPYASGLPYELRVHPRRHAASFADASEGELIELADVLPRLLRSLRTLVPGVSYNFVTRSGGAPGAGSDGFHWHLDLLPRLVRPDGFEIGTGIPVNPIPPEVAAARYREALAGPSPSGEKR